MDKYTAPAVDKSAFNCPRCGAFAKQDKRDVHHSYPGGEVHDGKRLLEGYALTECNHCGEFAVWRRNELIDPSLAVAPAAHEDMPDEIRRDFNEARQVAAQSPRSACALLRLATEKLCIHLKAKGSKLDDRIGNLVKEGILPRQIQRAFDTVRITGNSAVHPGELHGDDDQETATSLFRLVNRMVDGTITATKEIDELFERLPEGARKAIDRRDGKGVTTPKSPPSK